MLLTWFNYQQQCRSEVFKHFGDRVVEALRLCVTSGFRVWSLWLWVYEGFPHVCSYQAGNPYMRLVQGLHTGNRVICDVYIGFLQRYSPDNYPAEGFL